VSVRVLTALAVVVLLGGGCGGDPDGQAGDIVKGTARKLTDVKSGKLTLRLSGEAAGGEADGQAVGFSLEGPFAFAKQRGGLPVADLAVTRFAGEQRSEVQVISTGQDAFVELQGQTYELPAEQQTQLRAAGSGGKGLGGLEIDSWLRDAKVESGGDGVDHVSGKLDPVAAANDLLKLSGGERIEGRQADQLRDAVESASVDIWTGADDRILRRMLVRMKLGFSRAPAQIRERLKGFGGASFTLELKLDEPNSEVRVSAPEGAKPLPAAG
jgi:hypothetical protein